MYLCIPCERSFLKWFWLLLLLVLLLIPLYYYYFCVICCWFSFCSTTTSNNPGMTVVRNPGMTVIRTCFPCWPSKTWTACAALVCCSGYIFDKRSFPVLFFLIFYVGFQHEQIQDLKRPMQTSAKHCFCGCEKTDPQVHKCNNFYRFIHHCNHFLWFIIPTIYTRRVLNCGCLKSFPQVHDWKNCWGKPSQVRWVKTGVE